MSIKIVPLERLAQYHGNMETVIMQSNADTLSSAKTYTDSKIEEISGIDISNIYTKEDVDNALLTKVNVVDGMGLSSNDYTDDEKTKLQNINEGAEANVQVDWSIEDGSSDAYIKNKPTALPADGGNSDTVNGHVVESDVPSDAKFTDTIYDDTELVNTVNALSQSINTKADSTHNHDDLYDTIGAADTALESANTYTDGKVVNLISTTAVDEKITSHNTAIDSHNDIRLLITDLTTKLNTLADSDDTTLDQMSELVAYVKDNRDLIDSITTTKINVSDIIDNLTTSDTGKVLSANQGVAIKALIDTLQVELDSHGHVIADVDGLQTALDGKAEISHGTHVSYSTTVPVMAGTASTGTASTVARSDHKHPTDTSRASQADLTSHLEDSVKHITSTERTNWNSAYSKQHTHSNKTILDSTTASYTTAEKSKLDAITSITTTQIDALFA